MSRPDPRDITTKTRLIEAADSGAVVGEYVYNALGQRAIKRADGTDTVFIYDRQGNLMAEADGDGNIVAGYVYLNNRLLARIQSAKSIEAIVDIDPDTLNVNSNGNWVTCYIELPDGYYVEDIDVSSVMLNETVYAEEHPAEIGDYDYDGIDDLMVKFDRALVAAMLETGEEVEITVTGGVDTISFAGADTIRVIDKGGNGKNKGQADETPLVPDVPEAVSGSDTIYYYHLDHLGTPRVMTDVDGNIVWAANYDPFGEAAVKVQDIDNNFRFPGQYYDTESNLHYNYHRYYNPAIGRYMTPDPIGLAGGSNLYTYAEQNPIHAIDPLGLDTWSGAGDEVSGFLGFAGTSTMYGFVTNWDTGEKCYVETRCYKVGIGLAGGVTAQSIWIPNGPKRGKDLAGSSIGMGIEGGLAGYISGSPAGTATTSETGTTSLTGGAGLGAGFAEYAQKCTTRIISCENTPKQCSGN